MMKPRIKPIRITSQSLRLRVISAPVREPMGVMEVSAPSVKNIMPTMIITAPSKKHSRMLGEMGAMEKHSTSTIPMIGSTACMASVSFSLSLRQGMFNLTTAFLFELGRLLTRTDRACGTVCSCQPMAFL